MIAPNRPEYLEMGTLVLMSPSVMVLPLQMADHAHAPESPHTPLSACPDRQVVLHYG